MACNLNRNSFVIASVWHSVANMDTDMGSSIDSVNHWGNKAY